jgi:hypothetical protein
MSWHSSRRCGKVIEMGNRIKWPTLLEKAAAIVESYDTGVTLRQLFYRLVAEGLLANTIGKYHNLSTYTAKARRAGTFPKLIDPTSTIHRHLSFESPRDAREWLALIYWRDRTEGQEYSIYLAVEKAGILEQLRMWLGDYGAPILPLGGYASQTYVDDVVDDVYRQDRPVASSTSSGSH